MHWSPDVTQKLLIKYQSFPSGLFVLRCTLWMAIWMGPRDLGEDGFSGFMAGMAVSEE